MFSHFNVLSALSTRGVSGSGSALLSLAVLAAPVAVPAGAETTVDLVSVRDNTLFETEDGAVSNGSGPAILAGHTAQEFFSVRRALIRFDIGGAIPAGATILSAELRLEVTNQPPGAAPAPFTLYAVARDWGEGASAAIFNDGVGAPAESGDATWLHSFFPGSTWTTIGGDFSGAASGSAAIVGLGQHTIGSSPGMVADVQSWLDSPAGNFGWILIGDESTPQSARRFASREGSNPPLLVVTYEEGTPVPALPAAGFLVLALALAALGWAIVRRSRSPG